MKILMKFLTGLGIMLALMATSNASTVYTYTSGGKLTSTYSSFSSIASQYDSLFASNLVFSVTVSDTASGTVYLNNALNSATNQVLDYSFVNGVNNYTKTVFDALNTDSSAATYGRVGSSYVTVVNGVVTGFYLVDFTVPGAATYTYEQYTDGATTFAVVNGVTFTNGGFKFTNQQITQYYAAGSWSATAVPEPQVYSMILAGLSMIGFAARRKLRA